MERFIISLQNAHESPSCRKRSASATRGWSSTFGLLGLLLLATWPVRTARAQTAAELIEQAQQHDAAYAAETGVDRAKALELYEKALNTQPDRQQRLHALFRMAQLQGCIFDPHKGERPDLRKAIDLYQQIVQSCPPEEPLVLTAIGLISDHYTSLREFDDALLWAKRAVEYDTSAVTKNIDNVHRRLDSLATTRYTPGERQQIIHEGVGIASLQEGLTQMKAARVAAVDRVAYTAQHIDPLRAHGELRAIADKYAGTPVGDRAVRKLQESMDKRRDLWGPDAAAPRGPRGTWRVLADTPVLLDRDQNAVETPQGPRADAAAEPRAPDPNATEKPKAAPPLMEFPRAPPLAFLFAGVFVAAGLVILGLATRKAGRKTLSRNSDYET